MGLNKFEHTYLCIHRTHKGFKGTVVNRGLPSLHGGSLDIILTVPLCTLIACRPRKKDFKKLEKVRRKKVQDTFYIHVNFIFLYICYFS